MVKVDHQATIRASTRRVPTRSPHQPVGFSNMAYANVKALKTKLISTLDRRRSRMISGAVTEMQTRSV